MPKGLKIGNLNTMREEVQKPTSLLETLSSDTRAMVIEKKNSRGKGRPPKSDSIGKPDSDYIRATAVINKHQWMKLQIIARMEGVSLKDLLEAIYTLTISNYEDKMGEIKTNVDGKCDLRSRISK